MANANIEHALVASNESDDVAPLFRTPTPPRPHTSTLLIKCGKGALLVTALLALAALASHAANGPSHAAPFMATKTVGLTSTLTSPSAFGIALSAKTAGQPWTTVQSVYTQVQTGVGITDPAITQMRAYYVENPSMQAVIDASMTASQTAGGQNTTNATAAPTTTAAAGAATTAAATTAAATTAAGR